MSISRQEIREARALQPAADTSHESGKDWYDSYGAHIETEHYGDLEVQAVCWEWLDGSDENAERILSRDRELSRAEAEELVTLAREVRDAAEAIDSLLGDAVSAYQVGDLEACKRALLSASSIELDHGDDPATTDLAGKLLVVNDDCPAGHDGEHIACAVDDHALHGWPNTGADET